ncbi:MAG: outer membrane protein assembly factor [Rudanella sp.]|nr:outer membrane protein assembly factor [Rudanella sp.]
MTTRLLIVFLVMGLITHVRGDVDADTTTTTLKPFSLFPLPLIYYTPETRFAFGVAAAATFRFRRDTAHTVRPSQVTVGAAYTQNKQLLFYVPFQIFYNQNRYFANGEVGYYNYNYFLFGLRDRETPQETYGVNYPRIRLNLYRRITGNASGQGLYAGLRYQFENYDITSVQPEGLLASGTVPGGLGNRISGIGPGLLFDTRDNVLFPSHGVLADLSFKAHTRGIGSTSNFGRHVADVATYHSLTNRTTLALNYVLSLTTGVSPFSALSFFGGNKRGRGFYEGRYRDDNLALFQAEIRQQVWWRLGVVAFGSVGVLGTSIKGAAYRNEFLRFNQPKGAYGAGLRIRINNDKLNIRADYGRGLPQTGTGSSGFYLTIGEAF